MKTLIIALLSLTLVGCASTYSNRNTPNGNVVEATGAAAKAAASANTSHNCINCVGTQAQRYSNGIREKEYLETLTDSAFRSLNWGVTKAMNKTINDAIYK